MKRTTNSFTLIEIMVVITVIGILTTFAVPAVLRAFSSSKVARFVNDLKIVSNAFQFYAFDKGTYPPTSEENGTIPDGMQYYLRDFPWGLETSIGGTWNWQNSYESDPSILVNGHTITDSELKAIDEAVDDGNLKSGMFKGQEKSCVFLLER